VAYFCVLCKVEIEINAGAHHIRVLGKGGNSNHLGLVASVTPGVKEQNKLQTIMAPTSKARTGIRRQAYTDGQEVRQNSLEDQMGGGVHE
jgi:hypothetical protein